MHGCLYGWDVNIHISPFSELSKFQISGSARAWSTPLPRYSIFLPVIGLNHISCRKPNKISKHKMQVRMAYIPYDHLCLVKFLKQRRFLSPRKQLQHATTLFSRGLLGTPFHLPIAAAKCQGTHLQVCLVLFGHLAEPVRIFWAFLVLRHIFQPAKLLKLGHPTQKVWRSWHSW